MIGGSLDLDGSSDLDDSLDLDGSSRILVVFRIWITLD
jgi:hypothetical protein